MTKYVAEVTPKGAGDAWMTVESKCRLIIAKVQMELQDPYLEHCKDY